MADQITDKITIGVPSDLLEVRDDCEEFKDQSKTSAEQSKNWAKNAEEWAIKSEDSAHDSALSAEEARQWAETHMQGVWVDPNPPAYEKRYDHMLWFETNEDESIITRMWRWNAWGLPTDGTYPSEDLYPSQNTYPIGLGRWEPITFAELSGIAEAEAERVANETVRIENENERIDNEETRVAEFEQMKEDAVTFSFRVLQEGEYDPATGEPTLETGEDRVIYLAPSPSADGKNLYLEWIYVGDAWELFGNGGEISLENISIATIDAMLSGETISGTEVLSATGLNYYNQKLDEKFSDCADALDSAKTELESAIAEVDDKAEAALAYTLPVVSTTDAGKTMVVNSAGSWDKGGIPFMKTDTIPINRGGTGATTVASARNALGLGNTSGAVPLANGGTGATSLQDYTCTLIPAFQDDGNSFIKLRKWGPLVTVRWWLKRAVQDSLNGYTFYYATYDIPTMYRPDSDIHIATGVEYEASDNGFVFSIHPDGKAGIQTYGGAGWNVNYKPVFAGSGVYLITN